MSGAIAVLRDGERLAQAVRTKPIAASDMSVIVSTIQTLAARRLRHFPIIER
jgi:hypothetical protein